MVFEYSYVWLLPVFLLSFTVAWFKFRKLSRLPDIPLGIRIVISGLRFLVIFTLLLLLLNPALSLLQRTEEKPVLLIAQDNSASLIQNKDSIYYQEAYRESLNAIIGTLKNKFDVNFLIFGNTVRKGTNINYQDNKTDIAALFDYTRQNYLSHRPDAMILFSDGIYNSGVNPVYKTPEFPVYTVALGDTTVYPDVYVSRLETNKYNFMHTLFPVKAELVALKQQGETVKCILKENGEKIAEKTLWIDCENFWQEIFFEVEAKRKGLSKYELIAETVSKERTKLNNKAETWTTIMDNSSHIVVYASAPHPDIAAIVNTLQTSDIYDCKVYRKGESLDSLKADLFIFHNPQPGQPEYQKLLKELEKRKIAVWNILTNANSMELMAGYTNNYSVDFSSGLTEYAGVAVNQDFSLFELTDQEEAGYSVFPPVYVPFGEIKTGAGKLLFTQKIKNIPGSNGMFGFYDTQGYKTCYFWGNGLWKWRLYSYAETGTHDLFNALIQKTVSYLTIRKGTERFIHDIKSLYEDSEDILIHAELYNDSYELVNASDVKLKLKFDGKDFDYLLSRHLNKYKINLGNLKSGEYHYVLTTVLGEQLFKKEGVFYVRTHNSELNDQVANWQLLQEISKQTNAKTIPVKNLSEIVEILNTNSKFNPVYKTEISFAECRTMGGLGLILLLLLCLEWFLLRYYAG